MEEKYGFSSSNVENLETDTSDTNSTDEEVLSSNENMIIPISAWEAVVNQLGNIHEASQNMAEARERAAKAEAENNFLREKIINLKEDIEIISKKKRKFFSK
jgi:hypothetical protein